MRIRTILRGTIYIHYTPTYNDSPRERVGLLADMSLAYVLIGHIWRRTHHLLRARVRLLPLCARHTAPELAHGAEVGDLRYQLARGVVLQKRVAPPAIRSAREEFAWISITSRLTTKAMSGS